MRSSRVVPVLAAGLLLAACSTSKGPTSAKPFPSPVSSPFSFPAGYSPSPYTVREPTRVPTLAAGRPDACALLTVAEVNAAVFGPPRAPVMRDLGNVVRCTWGTHDLGRIIYVEVFTRTGQTAGGAAAMYNQNLKAAVRPVTLPGLGDGAFTAKYYAFVLKGSSVLKVTYQKPNFPDIDQSILAKLATEAGNRLSA